MTEIIEKKSRLIAYAKTVESEEEAKAFIARMAKEHKRARHIVYAYIVEGKEKHTDAGEPNGTAGLPVLTAIKKRGQSSVAAVVVRYFGGVFV